MRARRKSQHVDNQTEVGSQWGKNRLAQSHKTGALYQIFSGDSNFEN